MNRVIFNSQLDFETISDILISPPTAVPDRPGFQYINVLLFAKKKSDTPILFPYIYKTRLKKEGGKNNLKHWILVNNKAEEAYHLIKNFQEVKGK